MPAGPYLPFQHIVGCVLLQFGQQLGGHGPDPILFEVPDLTLHISALIGEVGCLSKKQTKQHQQELKHKAECIFDSISSPYIHILNTIHKMILNTSCLYILLFKVFVTQILKAYRSQSSYIWKHIQPPPGNCCSSVFVCEKSHCDLASSHPDRSKSAQINDE